MSPKSKGWTDPAEEPARRDDATPLSEIVGGLLGRRPFVRGVAVGRLARSWPDVVGERLAHETRPARQRRVAERLAAGGQTVISVADDSHVPEQAAAVWRVREGGVEA